MISTPKARSVEQMNSVYIETIARPNAYYLTLEEGKPVFQKVVSANEESIMPFTAYLTEENTYTLSQIPVALNKLSIPEVTFENTIAMYPNPTAQFLNLKGENLRGSATIYDLSGRMVIQPIEVSQDAQIDVSELDTGMYFLSISDSENKLSKKFIKN